MKRPPFRKATIGAVVSAAALASVGTFALASDPPASSKPLPDNETVRKGEALYQQVCAACHGAGGEGGPGGASNLARSPIAQAHDGGRTLGAFLAVGRPAKGMPPFALGSEQYAQLAAVLVTFGASAAPSTASATTNDVVLVGDAAAGKRYFNGPIGKCSTCHAVTDGAQSSAVNLARIGSKYPDAKTLQNNMVLNRTFFWTPSKSNDVTATVTYADGRKVEGLLTSVSDFKVVIRDAAGKQTVIPRRNGQPTVELHDRLQHHIDMLKVYKDSDMHDLTAYLVTLK